ncbi:type II secretion system F family protein [Homoserinibacter sp. YIM 151385]|uniref:type II secretion system F family protein n=1 Tax=Homoserinibacter sp. YIM 151385 TaxID=2985506 RepID=UPI0022F04537|nr:type II secretion system F family protein [Homoserinibacter sp. YIM 151385]WBU37646.1 type II secretion system F family protein [Homoserinibacter sp. YIM 151385]
MAGTIVSGAVKHFEYRARNGEGKLVKGRMEASSEGAVVDKLRTLGLSPTEVKETLAGQGLNRDISIPGLGGGVDLKSLSILMRQMATMIAAGLSLLKTLSILAEQTENKKLKQILGVVSRDVETGLSLSEALAKHPVEFPPLMINMVRAGETGGFLEGALESIATNFEKEAKLRATVKSAMTYPVMVLIMAFVAVLGMLIFIVPIFQKMFDGLGSELPAPTLILVALSQNMVWAAPLIIVLVFGGMAWWRVNKNKESVRARIDPLKLRLPVFGMLLKKIAIARFTRNLANMITAGVPILQALVVVGETSGNYVIEAASKAVSDSVRQGKSIAGPMAEHKVFPPMVVQMVAVGEDSGALETMLGKVSDFYDTEVDATTKALTSLIEPLLIAFLGVVVGGMIVALYMPIFSIASAVGGQ